MKTTTLYKLKIVFLICLNFTICGYGSDCIDVEIPPTKEMPVGVEFYLTTPDQSSLLALTTTGIAPMGTNSNFTISVTDSPNQTMDGFGFALTGSSAFLINSMTPVNRANLLQELFGNGTNDIGISYLRISIGNSDLDIAEFSYDDMPWGQTDVNLYNFSLAPDTVNLIPVLQEILAINPNIKIMATPWSPPYWMKSNRFKFGGQLLPQYYNVYAKYFVKYIQGMADYGITIEAVSIQSEPEHPFNNPSMLMNQCEQLSFVRDHLGPEFASENIQTKIFIFEHNLDNIEYAITILDDPVARNYIDGSSFHLYAGDIDNMSLVHDAHPDKNVYFTEQSMLAPGNFYGDMGWHQKNVMIGSCRNWSKTVLEWNLANDPNYDPHTDGGCSSCLGAITIDGENVTRNPLYYVIGHSSKFVPSGSTRIDSNTSSDFPNVAFKTPEGKTVVVVYNDSGSQSDVNIDVPSEPITVTIPASSIATLIWD